MLLFVVKVAMKQYYRFKVSLDETIKTLCMHEDVYELKYYLNNESLREKHFQLSPNTIAG